MNPYGVLGDTPRLDLAAISAWTAANERVRRIYHAEQDGTCIVCRTRKIDPERGWRCWGCRKNGATL